MGNSDGYTVGNPLNDEMIKNRGRPEKKDSRADINIGLYRR